MPVLSRELRFKKTSSLFYFIFFWMPIILVFVFVFFTKIASCYQLLAVHLAMLHQAVSQTTLLSDPLNFPLKTTSTDSLTQTNIESTR